MLPLVEKAEFAKRKREPLLDYNNYLEEAEDLIRRIPNAAKKLSDAEWMRDADEGALLRLTTARAKYALDLLSLSYSAGVALDALKLRFPEVLKYFEEYAIYSERFNNTTSEGRQNPGPHIAIRDTEFTQANRLVCFAILLGWPELLPRIMAIIEYNNDVLDAMLERLTSLYVSRPQPLPAECARHLPYYKTLAIFDAPPSDRAELMQDYLNEWYEASRREPYYDSHSRGSRFLGYWAWEAGAISIALKMDDRLYRDLSFYPRDMVDFCRQIPNIRDHK